MRASGREVIKFHFYKMEFLPPSQRLAMNKYINIAHTMNKNNGTDKKHIKNT